MQAILRTGGTKWGITVYKPKMVSMALLLLTVSTLATHGTALPTEQTITHECEGSTLCGVKPAGYPQEEIDRLVLQQLPYLRRMKRQAPLLADMELDTITPNGNCAVIKTSTPVFTIDRKNDLPEIVAQSKWFSQTVTEVKCLNDETMESGCFSAVANGLKTKCLTKTMNINLTTYNIKEKKLKVSSTEIGVDCVCVCSE